MNAEAKKWLYRIGSSLGLLGIAFVAYRIVGYYHQLTFVEWRAAEWLASAALTAAYALSNMPLAFGWGCLIRDFGFDRGARWYIHTYAVSQLAKYLPGNIFHYAGRQALGAASGIPHATLFYSAVLEIVIVIVIATCFAPLVAPTLWPTVSQDLALGLFVALLAGGAIVLLLLGRQHLSKAVVGYTGHLVMSTMIFVGAFVLAGGSLLGRWDAIVVAGAFTISWLAGLLTPGAPAGLGVREAMLVFLLQGFAAEPTVLTAAVLGRMITTLGDLLFFLVGRRV